MKVRISVAQPTPIPGFFTKRLSVAFLPPNVGRLDMVRVCAGTCWVHVWDLAGYQQLKIYTLV